MLTELLTTENDIAVKEAINRTDALLHAGDVVALPTETVYGLGADALNPDAVAKIFEAKERPDFDPLIVHVPTKAFLHEVAEVPEGLKKVVTQLVETFWPGPLTLVFPKRPHIPDIVTAGLPTVAVRMCHHPVFSKIIKNFGGPIAAPSANRFGRVSPTSAAAVVEEMEGRIPLVIDGGACSRGLESTIIQIEEATPKNLITILRPGPITLDELKKFGKVSRAERNTNVEENAPEAPGMLESHYSPTTPFRMLGGPNEFKPEEGKRYALLSYRGQPKDKFVDLHDWVEVSVLSPGSGRMAEAGIRLFHMMRQLDQLGVDEIICEPIPDRGVGSAILDRVTKASA